MRQNTQNRINPAPTLVVLSGLPGSGKSFFARQLARRISAKVIESDSVRKRLFRVPGYDVDENIKVFATIHRLAERLTGRGVSVIIDATNLTEPQRNVYYNISQRTGARYVPIRIIAPEGTVKTRLEQRANSRPGSDRSDAGWEIYLKMKPGQERIRHRYFRVDTSRDITPALNRITRALLST